jgi:hypothetical protein
MSIATTPYETTQTEELLAADLRLAMRMDAPAELGPLFPARSRPATAVGPQPTHVGPPAPRSRVLSRLLAMADSYVRAGSLRQAMEMYFELYNSHPDTPEASLAEKRILEVARRHEEDGELHSARAIYEQLL